MFYYCSNQTFLSIIQNKRIWLSDMTKSNDYAEIKGYFSILYDVAERVLGDKTYAKNANVTLKNRILKSSIDKLAYYHCLAMCFSSEMDSLSLWRAYGDDGRGVAIGFDEKEVRKMTVEGGGHPLLSLRPVVYYEPATLSEHLEDSAKQLVEKYKKHKQSEDRQRIVSEWIGRIFQEEAPFYKKKEFQSEKEVRLCYSRFIFNKQLVELINRENENKGQTMADYDKTDANSRATHESWLKDLRYRATRNDVIPYVSKEIKEYQGIINSVIIGPCNNALERDIHNAMTMAGFNKPEIKRSSVPYRSRN